MEYLFLKRKEVSSTSQRQKNLLFKAVEKHWEEEFVMKEFEFVVTDPQGIHARPASIFVQTATKFKSKVQIQAKGKTVDAKSILMIMSMGLVKGTEITIVADGPDEAEAAKALKDLVASKFGEE